MKHLEDEDIARMIEGKISKNERETFLRHLSECSTCFNVYTETFKFVEEDKKSKAVFRLPNLEKIKKTVQLFLRKPLLVPAFAVLILILLMLSLLIIKLPDDEIINAKTKHLAKRYEELENRRISAFARHGDKVFAAVRIGILIEDLSLLISTAGKEELGVKIVRMLDHELKVFASKENPLPLELANLEKKNFNKTVESIRNVIGNRSNAELFQLGRFIEQSILETFENKRPGKKEIEKYLKIVEKYHLPEGVIKNLQKAASGKDIKQKLEEIAEVFLAPQ